MTTSPDEFLRAVGVAVASDGIHIDLSNGTSITAPLTERLKKGTREQRNNWRFIAKGIGIHWPDLDEDLNVDELYFDSVGRRSLIRECRFCEERTRWNSEKCDNCGKERWNDPDDTTLGQALGKEERENYEVASARVRMDKATKELINHDE